jgi:CRP-like cAMP-binding protein
MQPKSLKSGDLFSGEDFGEPSVSFLYAGQCRVTILSPGGQHAAVRFVRPGSHFGEISILAEAVESPYHLLVDENSLIFQLSARKFRELLRSIPTLNENVLRNLARTAMARADRIYEFSLLDANLRLQAELLRLAQSGVRVGNQVTISNAPTREAVGTQIGISREGVSRLLHSLVQLGLIALKRSEIKIIDIKRLEANVARATGRSLRYRGEHRDWE